MEARYLPQVADFDRVSSWLEGEGFRVRIPDTNHTTVFVEGSVAEVARVFGIRFARVTASDGDYTSAIDAPEVPADLAPLIVGVNGLQPQFRLRHAKSRSVAPLDEVDGGPYVTPDNLYTAYDIPRSATGAGQIIAVVGEGPVATSDLSVFWSKTNVPQSLANFTTINMLSSATPDPSSIVEASLDVEWASAVAPGAQIRLYLEDNVFDCLPLIMNDLANYPAMRVISVSFGDTEATRDRLRRCSTSRRWRRSLPPRACRYWRAAATAAPTRPLPRARAGIPPPSRSPWTFPRATRASRAWVERPSTTRSPGLIRARSCGTPSRTAAARVAGGVSSVFAKPSWQTGGTVLAGQTMRCVPDVAAVSTANAQNIATGMGVYVYANGAADGRAGTSVACPVWAASPPSSTRPGRPMAPPPSASSIPTSIRSRHKRVQRHHERLEWRLFRRDRIRPLHGAGEPQRGKPDRGGFGRVRGGAPPRQRLDPRQCRDGRRHRDRRIRDRGKRRNQGRPHPRGRPRPDELRGLGRPAESEPGDLRQLLEPDRVRRRLGQRRFPRARERSRGQLPQGDGGGHERGGARFP